MFLFLLSSGGLDTLIRDLSIEDRRFITQRLNEKYPDGKVKFVNYSETDWNKNAKKKMKNENEKKMIELKWKMKLKCADLFIKIPNK